MSFDRYTDPENPLLPIFSQSMMSDGFSCEWKMMIKTYFNIEYSSTAIEKGNRFERCLFGNFDNTKLTARTLNSKAYQSLSIVADHTRKRFFNIDDVSKLQDEWGINIQRKIVINFGKYGLGGSLDYIGNINIDGKSIDAIVDIKMTGSLKMSGFYSVDFITSRRTEFIQAITYCYLYYRETGKILPFVQLVCTDAYLNRPIYKVTKVDVSKKDFVWLESTLKYFYHKYSEHKKYEVFDIDKPFKSNILNAPTYEDSSADPDQLIETCLGTYKKPKRGECKCLEYCKLGRFRLAGGIRHIKKLD